MKLLIGIDPGVQTGVAIWDLETQQFHSLMTCSILEAIEVVKNLNNTEKIEVWFEDARLRKFFGKTGREVLQGAGSIKRDCSIWEWFLTKAEIPFKAIPPSHNVTKVGARLFEKMTGLSGRHSEHARDAAMLVFKVKSWSWTK